MKDLSNRHPAWDELVGSSPGEAEFWTRLHHQRREYTTRPSLTEVVTCSIPSRCDEREHDILIELVALSAIGNDDRSRVGANRTRKDLQFPFPRDVLYPPVAPGRLRFRLPFTVNHGTATRKNPPEEVSSNSCPSVGC